MKRRIIILIVVACAVLVPSFIFAQGDLSLEGLNDRLEALEEKMTNLTPGLAERVQALESLFTDPWSPEVVYTDDGVCQNPLHSKQQYGRSIRGEIRQETADAYRAAYGVSIDPDDDVYLSGISFGVDSNHVYLEYIRDDRFVVEQWAHCEFLGHSEWTEVD